MQPLLSVSLASAGVVPAGARSRLVGETLVLGSGLGLYSMSQALGTSGSSRQQLLLQLDTVPGALLALSSQKHVAL